MTTQRWDAQKTASGSTHGPNPRMETCHVAALRKGRGRLLGKYLLFGLLGLLVLLLFAPVKTEMVWRRAVFHLRLRFLWLFPVTVLPKKERTEKAARPKRKKKAKAPKAQKEKPQAKRDPGEILLEVFQLVNDLLPRVGEFFGRLARGITVSRCRIALVVSGEEADAAGIACGRAYALGYGAYSVLSGVVRVEEFVYHVMPDFLSGEGAADVEATVEIRPVTLLAAGCLFLFHFVKAFLGRQMSREKRVPGPANSMK